MKEQQIAWHFVGDTLLDGRPVPQDGIPLVHSGELILCQQGLHASIDPFDALSYAPGSVLCKVLCEGRILRDQDKLVCDKRTILARMDFAEPLRYFARMQALSVIHLAPDMEDVVLDYLMTGDKELLNAAESATRSAAWSAAWSAARSATRSAAWSAARSAARSAAESASWSATRSAAESATRSAVEFAAWSAAWSAARAEFNSIVMECFS